MSTAMFWQLILAAALITLLCIYRTTLSTLKVKLKEWSIAERSAHELRDQLRREKDQLIEQRSKLHAERQFLERGGEAVSASQKVALDSVTVLANVMEQVPMVLSPEEIRERLFRQYDPNCMFAAFLSVSRYESTPHAARNVLLTVLYGREPGAAVGRDDFFVRIYSPSGELQIAYLRSTGSLGPLGVEYSEWKTLMTVTDLLLMKKSISG